MDGSAFGSLDKSGCGDIFRTSRGFLQSASSWSLPIGFAFKAEIMAFILAIEKFMKLVGLPFGRSQILHMLLIFSMQVQAKYIGALLIDGTEL